MRLLNYSVVGAVATLVHYAVLIFLVEISGVVPTSATAVGALCGALVAFFVNRHFTFRSYNHRSYELPRFLLVAGAGAVLNWGVVWFGSLLLGVNYMIPQMVATLITLLLTFELNRSWTFSL